jgi:hypothetical protein
MTLGCCAGYFMEGHLNHEHDLGDRIKKWMGPQYTLVSLLVRYRESFSIFVHSEFVHSSTRTISLLVLVGEHDISLGFTLGYRYSDWARAAVDDSLSIYDPGFRSRLPRPFNKGNSWIAEAMAAIKVDIIRFDNVEEWRIFWDGFIVVQENDDTFDLWVDEFSLQQMHDGIKLLGL